MSLVLIIFVVVVAVIHFCWIIKNNIRLSTYIALYRLLYHRHTTYLNQYW